jgi:hypothetical protein
MNNKITYVIGGGAIVVLVLFLAVNAQSGSKVSKQSNTALLQPTQNPQPTVSSQNPQDIVPGLYSNPIQNASTTEGFVLSQAVVENNVDGSGKPVDDHLELSLKNTSGKDLTNFEVYYTITDTTNNKKEGYYKKLTGFVLKSGQTKSIHFNNQQGDDDFPVNKNGLYYTSSNKLLFDVEVSTPGYKIQTQQIEKAAGGAETQD